MIYKSITDIGKTRSINQDNYANYSCNNFSIHIVADGMGGHKAGEIAAKIAAETIRDYVIKNKENQDHRDLLETAVRKANEEIIEQSKENDAYKNMGTTVVCCLIADKLCHVINVGDSRLYLHREGKLSQMTKDDSYVQTLIEQGAVASKVNLKQYQNIITNALGFDLDLEMSYSNFELKTKDKLLLATDGLTNMVDDDDIEDLLNMETDLQDMCEILVYMANNSGGYDNITATLLEIDGE